MKTMHLAAGIARDGERLLLVASRYPDHPDPLWNLPGGRIEPGELYHEAVVRELREETGLDARIARFAYLSESYDGDVHFVTAVFEVDVEGELTAPCDGDHVAEVRWCTADEARERLQVAVVREPLFGYLATGEQYFARHDAGISVRWP